MASKIEAYVDTSALIAFVDRSDSYHPLFTRLFSDPPKLITTPLVIAEGQGWFLRRYDRRRALEFMALIELMTPLKVSSIGPKQLQGATEVMRRYSDQDLTLTDAMGMVIMEQRKIQICWSTDRHLGLGGVPLVIHR
jgi:predicted nucleic acid-binding protein